MADTLAPIEQDRLQLLLHEYEMFDRRISVLMGRLTGAVASLLVVLLPPLFRVDPLPSHVYVAVVATITSWLVFFLCQISCQMLTYKRHMVHIARLVYTLHSCLELQWDLYCYDRIYGELTGARKLSERPATLIFAVLLVVVLISGYVLLFLVGQFYLEKVTSHLLVYLYYILTLPVIVAGPILLWSTHRRLQRAYTTTNVPLRD